MEERHTETVVIGAGAAGLAAARVLAQAGGTVALVEAKDRFGGRAYTRRDARSAVPIELGAEFIHGRAPITFALLREMGRGAVDVHGSRYMFRDGELRAPQDDSRMLETLMHSARRLEHDETVDAFLHRYRGDSEHVEAIRGMRLLVQGFDAADPSEAGIKAIAEEYDGASGASEDIFRPIGGYRDVMDHLIRSLPPSNVALFAKTVVEKIDWSGDGVAVTCKWRERFVIRARRAIITVPLGVLQAPAGETGAIVFTPELPSEKHDAIDRLAMGHVIKVCLRYATAFWEDLHYGRYIDTAFFTSLSSAFPAFWTSLPQHSSLLVAWAGGPSATQLQDCTDDECIDAAVASVTHLFGDPRAHTKLEAAFVHNWQRDPFARGAYSYAKTNAGHARPALARSVKSRLFFAGEATAPTGDAGTVAGALQSGIRAANEVLGTAPR